jgi:LysM repeat protein
MTKKDTILIAVLINAGLLIVMFVFAIKPSAYRKNDLSVPESSAEISNQSAKNEIDQMLNAYVEGKEKKNENLQKKETELAAKTNFEFHPMKNSQKESKPVEQNPAPLSRNEPSKTNYTSVVIKAGDALEKIAKIHSTSVKEIMDINHLENTKLRVGQVLYLPSPVNKALGKVPESGLDHFYIVKNGDNPWTIASKNHIKIEELLRLNNLDENKAKKIKPGDRLRIK